MGNSDKPASQPPVTDIGSQIDQVETVVTDKRVNESYVPLGENELTAVPVETIPLGMPLPCALYIRVGGSLVLFRNTGDKLTSQRARQLGEKGAQTLFIPTTSWEVFLKELEKMQLPTPITPESSSAYLRNLIIAYGMEIQKKIKEPKKPLFDKLQKLCNSLAEAIHSDPSIGGKLLRKHDEELSLHWATHSVNVAIYAAVIGHKLGFTLAEMSQLTYAAALHDLGTLLVPKSILLKKTDWTEEEKKEMAAHPRLGAELLQSIGAAPAAIATAMQHHERMDGKGYPSGIPGKEIHYYAKICAIADAYDALTGKRPCRPAMSPLDALNKLKSLEGKFDMKLLGVAAGG